jgi:hypothetical protein
MSADQRCDGMVALVTKSAHHQSACRDTGSGSRSAVAGCGGFAADAAVVCDVPRRRRLRGAALRRLPAGWFLITCDPDTYQRVPAAGGLAPPTAELAQIYQHALGRGVTDLAWFTALACFKSAATWSRLLERALSMLD